MTSPDMKCSSHTREMQAQENTYGTAAPFPSWFESSSQLNKARTHWPLTRRKGHSERINRTLATQDHNLRSLSVTTKENPSQSQGQGQLGLSPTQPAVTLPKWQEISMKLRWTLRSVTSQGAHSLDTLNVRKLGLILFLLLRFKWPISLSGERVSCWGESHSVEQWILFAHPPSSINFITIYHTKDENKEGSTTFSLSIACSKSILIWEIWTQRITLGSKTEWAWRIKILEK